MSDDRLPYHRRSIRLQGYDYSQNGAYFVTICTYGRLNLLGQIGDGEMVLNRWGVIVQQEWGQTAILRPNVELDAFVIMPNHVHGIIVITDVYGSRNADCVSNSSVGAQCIAPLQAEPPSKPTPRGATPNNVMPNSLGAIVRGFKAAVTRQINRLPDAPEHPVWQRNYHEHIIRNEKSLQTIREYVANNPARWAEDSLYVGE